MWSFHPRMAPSSFASPKSADPSLDPGSVCATLLFLWGLLAQLWGESGPGQDKGGRSSLVKICMALFLVYNIYNNQVLLGFLVGLIDFGLPVQPIKQSGVSRNV